MKTRRTLDLSTKTIADLQLYFDRTVNTKKLPKSQSDSSLSALDTQKLASLTGHSNQFGIVSSVQETTMSTTDELEELREIQHKQAELEKKIFDRIPCYKPSTDANVLEFLAEVEFVFDKLSYSDDIRLMKVADKLDPSFKTRLFMTKRNGFYTWAQFRTDLIQCSQQQHPFDQLLLDLKQNDGQEYSSHDIVDKPSVVESIRREIEPFSGEEEGLQWFKRLDKRFVELNVPLNNRLEILPNLFYGEAMIWFSLNQEKILRYTDFCQMFILAYSNRQTSVVNTVEKEQDSKSMSTHSPLFADKEVPNSTNSYAADKSSNDSHSPSPSPPHHIPLSSSIVSSTISKALIDRFLKDPIKFSSAKDNVITWLEEVEQQFGLMNLTGQDRLNLIHICLKGEAHHWYKHNKHKFLSWSVFIHEITNYFTSHSQRDSSFKKLKEYHQSMNQSVMQYYTEMVTLIHQADTQMNESTKVQYLMNGLIPSLSIETRRSYPKTTDEFLKQARVAEELTSLNSSVVATPMPDEEFSIRNYSQYRRHIDPEPNKTRFDYSLQKASNQSYREVDYSPNEPRRQRFVNQISTTLPHQSNGQHESSRSSQSFPDAHRPRKYSSFHSNDSYRTNNAERKEQQRLNPQQRSALRCFRCGSYEHMSRQCHHFEHRSQ